MTYCVGCSLEANTKIRDRLEASQASLKRQYQHVKLERFMTKY